VWQIPHASLSIKTDINTSCSLYFNVDIKLISDCESVPKTGQEICKKLYSQYRPNKNRVNYEKAAMANITR